MADQLTRDRVLEALGGVLDPDLQRDVVSLGMIQDLAISGGDVSFRFVLTTPACPVREQLENEAREAVLRVPGVERVDVKMASEVPRHRISGEKKVIEGVRNIVAVTSGKGGVGKTTVSVNLAYALSLSGARVGLLDCDIYGPNVPIMLGLNDRPMAKGNRIIPLQTLGMKVMSMGFLTDQDTPLIWRGPMLHGVVQQFLYQVEWGELDYLIADLPPGTGDVQLTMIQSVPLTGGVVVTTPQDVALGDARKGIMMFKQVNVEVLGLVENMSFFVCPRCGERTEIFSHGGGERTSELFKVPFLGRVPLETAVRIGGDKGVPITVSAPSSASAKAFSEISKQLAARISTLNMGNRPLIELEM